MCFWRKLIRIVKQIFHFNFFGGDCHPHHFPERFHFDYRIGLVTTKKESSHMDITLTNEQQVTVTINPKTPKGKPVTLDGAPTWAVTAGSCTIAPSADGLSCLIVSGDDAGDSEITVSADADLGAGVVTVSDALRVTVVGAQAESLGLIVGKPELKPDTP